MNRLKFSLEGLLLVTGIVAFGLGIALGGLIMSNSNAMVTRMMAETREDLKRHKYSVVLVDKGLAEYVGYVPAKKDIVIAGGEE